MFTIVDFNNFWSPSGGGVRRYHLQKMEFYMQQKNVLLVFAMPDSKTFTEIKSETLIIEHIKAFRFPGKWEYRFMWKKSQIAPVLQKYKPQIIEVGSPYILPTIVQKVAKKIVPKAALTGFWHADFPITYVERPVTNKLGKTIGNICKRVAFFYARHEYKKFDCIQVSCNSILERLKANKLPDPRLIPLGCDIQTFAPNKRDIQLVEKLKAGAQDRLTIFFPHRFCEEKGIDLLLKAYPILSKALGLEPTIIFAGTGPYLPQVQEAAKKYVHIKYIGFVQSISEMAKFYASVDIGLALSGWETFGLSILESMASGNAQVAANTGAAAEHIINSNAGIILNERTPEALAKAITTLYNSDLSKKKANARIYAEQFSWSYCFERQLKLYKLKQKDI